MTISIHAVLLQLATLITTNDEQNIAIVQQLIQQGLELLPSQIDTQPGELFHVCLSKISYYWLSNQFDSGLLSKLILMLKRQDQRHGKLIESIAEIVKILYRKDYEKFTLFMSDFVQLVQDIFTLKEFTLVSSQSKYLSVAVVGGSQGQNVTQNVLELLVAILEFKPVLKVSLEKQILEIFDTLAKISQMYQYDFIPRLGAVLLAMGLSEQDIIQVSVVFLNSLEYALDRSHKVELYEKGCEMLANSMTTMVGSIIKHQVYNIYSKLDGYADVEVQLFRIWSRLPFTITQDYMHIDTILGLSERQDVPDRIKVIKKKLVQVNEPMMLFMIQTTEKITEMVMSTVDSEQQMLLPWYLYLILFETKSKELQDHYQSFFEFIANCLPSRIIDLNQDGCMRILENIAKVCLVAEYTKTMDFMHASIQNYIGILLCIGIMPVDESILFEDKGWQRAFQHCNRLKLYQVMEEDCLVLMLKALTVLPSNRYSFHAFAYLCDLFKTRMSLTLWKESKLLLQSYWTKHQSLELFCKYLGTVSISKELYECFVKLIGFMHCIESQKFEFKLMICGGVEKDLFEFELDCKVCKGTQKCLVNARHVSSLYFRLAEHGYANDCRELVLKGLYRIFSHDIEQCNLSNINMFVNPITNENCDLLPLLLSTKLPRDLLIENFKILKDQLQVFVQSSTRVCLKTIGTILQRSYDCDELFFELVQMLVDYSCHASQVHRALAISELLEVPTAQFGVILKNLSIWSIRELETTPKLVQSICQILGKSTSEFIEMTWPFTLPGLVQSKETSMVTTVITKGKHLEKVEVVKRLVHYSGDIMAYLLVYGESSDLDFFLGLLEPVKSTEDITYGFVFRTNQLQLLRNIVVECGDLDSSVQAKAIESLGFVYSTLYPDSADQVGRFLLSHALGILTKLQSYFVPSEFMTSLAWKKKVVRGIDQMVRLIGTEISGVSTQLLGFLQTISEDVTLLEESFNLWKSFIHQLSKEALQELFILIALNLLDMNCSEDHEDVLIEIFHYLVVQNIQNYPTQIRQISSRIPNTIAWKHIKDATNHLSLPKSIQHQLVDLVELISHENNTVVLDGLRKLQMLLVEHQLEVEKMISSDSVDRQVKNMIQKLCLLVHRHNSTESVIGLVACECLGIIGPIDPVKMDISIRLNPLFGPQVDLSHFEGALNFVCSLIESYLAPTFRATQDSNYQSLLAFTIQNALDWCGFNRQIISDASLMNTQKIKPTTQSILASRWKRFPKHIVSTISPLLESRYKMPKVERLVIAYPQFPNCSSYSLWIKNWSLDLLYKISNETKRNIFRLFENVIGASDTNIIQILLPHLVHQVILGNNEEAMKEVSVELLCILSSTSSSEMHQLALQMVFHMLEYFSKWIRNARIKMSQKRVRNAPATNMKSLEDELSTIEGFLARIPQDLLSTASIRCHSYARALLHLEHHFRDQQDDSSTDVLLNQMQRIYAQLDDPDSLEGLSTKILNPSLEQQIIHHEVCGRWSAAQSCYEVLLQQNPQDTTYQMGLLDCLQNMGHYESMVTYSKGILATDPSKVDLITPYSITASWKLGDWDSLEKLTNLPSKALDFEALLGKLLLCLKNNTHSDFENQINTLRKNLISSVAAATMESYHRAYDSILQLSVLYDMEQFQKVILESPSIDITSEVLKLKQIWQLRLNAMSPSFKTKESVLNLRRILLGVAVFQGKPNSDLLQEQKGWLWIQTAKQSRKNEYFQTAYSAILQAKLLIPGPARVEQAKWYRFQNQQFEAISELKIATGRDLKTFEKDTLKCLLSDPEDEKKATLQLARWLEETNGMYSAVVLKAFTNTYRSFQNWEKAAFFLGCYYYRCYVDEKQKSIDAGIKGGYTYGVANAAYLTCKTYGKSLGYGSKYLHQSMPRLITTWLDLGAANPLEIGKGDIERLKKKLQQNNDLISKLFDFIPKFQFLSAIPQLISRICHPNVDVQELLDRLIVSLLESFHQQTLWHLMAVAKSTVKSRVNRVATIFSKAKALDAKSRLLNLSLKIQVAEQFTDNLMQLCNFPVSQDMTSLSLSTHFRKLHRLLADRPIDVIIPLQSSMVGTLPLPGTAIATHRPFQNDLPTIMSFHDEIQILPSLQRPRKITIEGSDGKSHVFLCKSDDDLRKDSRLMEVNAIINKLLKKDSESKKRNLHIRTYTVVPLNEKCGLIQWVSNMNGYRNIMIKIYKSKNKYTHHQIIKDAMDKAKTVEEKVKVFSKEIVPKHPPLFREWFFEMFPEPTKWIASRKAYTSTLATMSMVGFIVGLGDRHGENILFDENSGDCLHVDLNCLFEKGLEFSVPERVPFRLTHNMVDAFGVYGVEGPFRKSCEAAMNVLRSNRELLMSVLETFLHDPLCEWNKKSSRSDGDNPMAIKSLKTIDKKLSGFAQQSIISLSVAGQVDELISMATDPQNLAQMYIGWAPFL